MSLDTHHTIYYNSRSRENTCRQELFHVGYFRQLHIVSSGLFHNFLGYAPRGLTFGTPGTIDFDFHCFTCFRVCIWYSF